MFSQSTPRRITLHLSGSSIFNLIQIEFDALHADHIWKKCTHIVYDALAFDSSNLSDIYVGDQRYRVTNAQQSALIDPKTYVPWLRQLKSYYPHLLIYWSLPPAVVQNMPIMNLVNRYGWQNYFDKCAKLALDLPFDGLEINLSMCNSFGPGFVKCVDDFPFKLQCVLPTYQNALMQNIEMEQVQELYDICDSLVVNTYGYMKFCRVGDDQSCKLMTTDCDNKISDFLPALKYLKDTCQSMDKVQIGMDTVGVEFEKNSHNENYLSTRFRMLPVSLIEHYRDTQMDAELAVDLIDGGSYLDTETSLINYDCTQLRMHKLEIMITQNLQGVCIGDIKNDINHLSPYCLLNLAYECIKQVTELTGEPLPQLQPQSCTLLAESCEPDDTQSAEISWPELVSTDQ